MLLANKAREILERGGPPPNFNVKLKEAFDSSIKFRLDFDPVTFQFSAFPDAEKFMALARTFARLPADICWLEHPIDPQHRGQGEVRGGESVAATAPLK